MHYHPISSIRHVRCNIASMTSQKKNRLRRALHSVNKTALPISSGSWGLLTELKWLRRLERIKRGCVNGSWIHLHWQKKNWEENIFGLWWLKRTGLVDSVIAWLADSRLSRCTSLTWRGVDTQFCSALVMVMAEACRWWPLTVLTSCIIRHLNLF